MTIPPITAKDKYSKGDIDRVKLGDPFLVSDVGRLSDCGLQHVSKHCKGDGHFAGLFSTDDLEASLVHTKNKYVAAEMKVLLNLLSESNVEYFVLRQLS